MGKKKFHIPFYSSARNHFSSTETDDDRLKQILKKDGGGSDSDVDLDLLINRIDKALNSAMNKDSGETNPFRHGVDWPTASDSSKILEGASTNAQLISTEISNYSGDTYKTAIAILDGIGNAHWAGVGLLVVAAVIERFETISSNRSECLELLCTMNKLAKHMKQLKDIPNLKKEMEAIIGEAVDLIVQGAHSCLHLRKMRRRDTFFSASKKKAELTGLRSRVDDMYKYLSSQMQICTLEALHGMTSRSHIPQRTDTADRKAAERLYPDHAVGIGDEVNKVIEMLQLESEKCAVAVAVCGFGGAGKSTLGDAVYARLNLEGYKHSKVDLNENPEVDLNLNPEADVEKLQSQILNDLTGKTQEIKEMRSGQQALRKIMQKETVFPFVDSVLQIEHLRHLLPKKLFIKSAQNKIRLFLTVQGDQNVALALKNWRFQSCEIYKMKPLSTEAAMQLLCRKFVVDSEKRTIHERPEVKKLVQLCSGCPRVLEEVGAYLDRSKNADAAFDKVIKWLEHGLSFSAAKENGFGEPNIQDLHDDLPEDAKDVFLDICFFFNGWNWDEVECVVGDQPLKMLEDSNLKS